MTSALRLAVAAALLAPTLALAQTSTAKKPPPASPAKPATTTAAPAPAGAKPSTNVPLPPPPGAVATPDLRVAPPSAPPKPKLALRLAVPDIKVTGELPPRQLALFETSLLAEFRKLEGVSAIGMSEIREMLSFEYQRQMMGCAADEACLAEIGGALGTDEMVHAAVIVEGNTANFSMKRINMRTARVTGTHSKRLTRAGGEELLGAVGPAIQELFPDRNLKPGQTRGVDKAIALRLNPPPLPKWPFYTAASAAVVAATAGTVYALLAKDSANQYNSLAEQSLTESVPGSELKELEDTANARAQNATILYATSGVLAVGAGVMALFTDWHGYGAQVEVGNKAATVKVGGTF